MPDFTFERWVAFADGDSGDRLEFTMTFTDAEYALLDRLYHEGESLWEVQAVNEELYWRIHDSAADESRAELCDDDAEDADSYSFGVDFPELPEDDWDDDDDDDTN